MHGDGHATVWALNGLRWFQNQFESALEMKTVNAGHRRKQDVATEAKILTRVIRAVPGGRE